MPRPRREASTTSFERSTNTPAWASVSGAPASGASSVLSSVIAVPLGCARRFVHPGDVGGSGDVNDGAALKQRLGTTASLGIEVGEGDLRAVAVVVAELGHENDDGRRRGGFRDYLFFFFRRLFLGCLFLGHFLFLLRQPVSGTADTGLSHTVPPYACPRCFASRAISAGLATLCATAAVVAGSVASTSLAARAATSLAPLPLVTLSRLANVSVSP